MLSKEADHYLIVDTNVVLHQADFLEHQSIEDVVILSTVYKEVQHKNSSTFLRLKNLLRNKQKRFYYFSNEYHKVTFRTAAIGFAAHPVCQAIPSMVRIAVVPLTATVPCRIPTS